ncbi:MAG: cell division protein ZapE [Magnetovibrionaceae bacterium]
MPDGPLTAYRQKIADGEIMRDPAQALAVEKLQSLHHALKNYEPSTGKTGWKERFGLARRKKEKPPMGLYMFGGVGRGKSMLMDLFFERCPVRRKRRVHFHAFMRDVHRRFKDLRGDAKVSDPVPPLAEEIAHDVKVLCFDEFHVTDIADAMILGRLFEALLDNGVVVVATSNRHPDDLYKDGLQRENFLPFIALIKAELEVYQLDSGTDYRLRAMETMKTYLTPVNKETSDQLLEDFRCLTDHADAGPAIIPVQGREIVLPMAYGGVGFAGFADLCAKALGPGDYLEIAALHHTLILAGIPKMGPEMRDQAKRFVTLIDALYEARTNLICSAEVPVEDLYPAGDGSFEFERTASRLIEMRGAEYIALAHLGG